MEFITAVLAGGTTGVVASAGILAAAGADMRQRVKDEARHWVASGANYVAHKAEVAREAKTEGGGTSIVENPDGTLEKVDMAEEVVDLRKEINYFEAMQQKIENNPNRPYPREWDE